MVENIGKYQITTYNAYGGNGKHWDEVIIEEFDNDDMYVGETILYFEKKPTFTDEASVEKFTMLKNFTKIYSER